MIIGKLSPNQPITIVGAGISGLLLGHYLKKQNISFTIHEKNQNPGGLISTQKTALGLVETAANGIVLSNDVSELIHDLKLEALYPTPQLKRYIHRDNQLKTFPFHLRELLTAFTNLARKTNPSREQSLNDFLQPVFGKKFCQEVVSSGVRGIYAIGGDELDYEALLPKAQGENYFSYLKKILKNKRGNKIQTISFKNGMQELVDSLKHELSPHIRLNSNFEFTRDIQNIIFCTDAHAAAKIIKEHHPKLATLLKNIPYKSISTNTVFTKKPINQLEKSFGLLSSFLNSYGILANDQIFSNRSESGVHSYTMIKPISSQNRNEIIEDLKQFGLHESDIRDIVTTDWNKGIPRYNLERKKIIHELAQEIQATHGLLFFGNYVSGLSLRDLIKTAKQFSLEAI